MLRRIRSASPSLNTGLGCYPSIFLVAFRAGLVAANAVFQQILRGPSRLELLEDPFQNQFCEIAKLSFLAGSKLLKVSSKSLPDPQAELCLLFAHFTCHAA